MTARPVDAVPMTVERTEARRCHRLVHRRPILHPRIWPRHAFGVGGEPRCKIRGKNVRVMGAATMVDEPDDWSQCRSAQLLQCRVSAVPIEPFGIAGDMFPQHRIAQTAQPEGGEPIKVVQPLSVAGAAILIMISPIDPIDRAFVSAP